MVAFGSPGVLSCQAATQLNATGDPSTGTRVFLRTVAWDQHAWNSRKAMRQHGLPNWRATLCHLLIVLAAVYHHTVSLLSPMYLTLCQALTAIKTWCLHTSSLPSLPGEDTQTVSYQLVGQHTTGVSKVCAGCGLLPSPLSASRGLLWAAGGTSAILGRRREECH